MPGASEPAQSLLQRIRSSISPWLGFANAEIDRIDCARYFQAVPADWDLRSASELESDLQEFSSWTQSLVAWIVIRHPYSDPESVQKIHDVITHWHASKSVDDLPSQSVLRELLDCADIVLHSLHYNVTTKTAPDALHGKMRSRGHRSCQSCAQIVPCLTLDFQCLSCHRAWDAEIRAKSRGHINEEPKAPEGAAGWTLTDSALKASSRAIDSLGADPPPDVAKATTDQQSQTAKPKPSTAVDYAAIASELRKKGRATQAKLVEHMEDKLQALAEEIASFVHGHSETSEKAMRNNAKRTNDSLADLGVPMSFRLASGRMFKDVSPE